MGIFAREKENELALVFDIESSSVGGALFRVGNAGVPKIILSFREPITLEKNIDIDKFLSLTAKSLEIVAEKIYMAKLGAPERIFCVLSSPWHVSQTRVIKLSKNTPFIFTTKFANSLVQKEISIFEEEHLAKYENAGSSVRLIEFKNIKTMLNGYETTQPLNQKAKELEMTIFISISPEQVLQKIAETIRKNFHFKVIKFSSFVLASFTAVRDMQIHNEDFLLLDIGGEVTDISMVKKNILHESISFPFGSHFIIRGVADTSHSSLAEARSLVTLLQSGHSTASVTKKLNSIVASLKIEWLNKFQESLASLSKDISIPATIYIAVDKDWVPFFSQTIENEQFSQYTLTESKFKITILSTEILNGMATFENNVIRDPRLIIDAIFINRFGK